jgi:hypothetical protein
VALVVLFYSILICHSISPLRTKAELQQDQEQQAGDEARRLLTYKLCQYCGSVNARKKCNGCNKGARARYCGRVCQKADWVAHKIFCPRCDKIQEID